MYKPELAYRSEAKPSEERVMKGYTCGRLEKKRHRVHFSVLLVTDPQERSKAWCQRNSSYTNGLKSITRKYIFVTIIIHFLAIVGEWWLNTITSRCLTAYRHKAGMSQNKEGYEYVTIPVFAGTD